MKCCEREQLFAYCQRLLAADEEEKVRAHVAECAACRAVVGEYEKLDTLLDDWQPAEPSPWFDARVRAAIAADSSRAESARPRFGLVWVRWLAPAVGLAVVLVAVLVVWRSHRPQVHPVTQAVIPAAAPQVPQNVANPVSAPAVKPAPALQIVQTRPVSAQPAAAAADEDLRLYEDLSVLEDYDLLAGFDVLSELPKGEKEVAN
jgi:hypothetical protein